MRIVDIGANHMDERLISIEINPGTNLFKFDPERLPLFAGWTFASGDTVANEDIQEIRPEKLKEGESVKAYLMRLQEYTAKLAQLNQWYLTMRSRDAAEDRVILEQIQMLNNLSYERFRRVTDYALFEHFPPTDDSFNERNHLIAMMENLANDPAQTGPNALYRKSPKGLVGERLGIGFPHELNGFGIRIQTWNYASMEVAYCDGVFHLIRATFTNPDSEELPMDLNNPVILNILDDFRVKQRK